MTTPPDPLPIPPVSVDADPATAQAPEAKSTGRPVLHLKGPLPAAPANEFNEVEPPARTLTIKAPPKVRNMYWCDLWTDAVKPEFWKRRPVIVISYENGMTAPCLVVPVTTQAPRENPWAYQLPVNYVQPGLDCWAICNHLLTVSPVRLTTVGGKVPRLTDVEFEPILRLVYARLPALSATPQQAPQAAPK